MKRDEYKRRRYEILEEFYLDMRDRVGLQEPVKESVERTSGALGRLIREAHAQPSR